MSQVQRYIIYRTVAVGTEPAGYVTNAIIWDGASKMTLPSGVAAVADPQGQYPIGGTYTSASPST